MGKDSILIPEEPSRRLGCWNGRKQGCRVCGWIRTAEAGFGPRFRKPRSHGIERAGKLKLSDSGDLERETDRHLHRTGSHVHRMQERNADEVARKKFLEERVTSQIAVPPRRN